jgi:uncharacterized protein (DUF362 family)
MEQQYDMSGERSKKSNKLTRREFIGSSVSLCFAAPVLLRGLMQNGEARETFVAVRKRLPNPYMENGKPIVVVVKGTDYSAMLSKGMETLGGFKRFGTGKSVILKPNFVFDRRTKYPTTTDVHTVLTTVDFLKKEGFTDITVADRRGKKSNSRAGGKFEWSGLNDKAEAGGFKTDSLMDNDQAETVMVKDSRWSVMPTYGVIKKIYDADLIINMPTLKRHFLTHLTCSLKNMMGVLDVPTTMNMHLWGDENKTEYESLGQEKVTRRLCLTISEAASAVNPEVSVIDARQVLCKNHVSNAEGMPRDANRLIISGDPVAADVVSAKILKDVYEEYDLGPTRETFDYAAKLGIGVADPDGFVLKDLEV